MGEAACYYEHMKLLGLRTLIYPSANLEEDKKWWAEALGFKPYFDQPFYVGFNVGGYELGLDPNASPKEGPKTYYGVENMGDAMGHFTSLGCVVHEGPFEPGDGIIVSSLVMPTGQLLHLIYNRHIKPNQPLAHVA